VIYLDAAYVAKTYLTEPDSAGVRALVESARRCYTSAISLVEVRSTFHRHYREGIIAETHLHQLSEQFDTDVEKERWSIVALSPDLLNRAGHRFAILPPNVFLRAGDAIHLVSALEARSDEIWTNDRRLLAAASHFGLLGRTI